MNQTTETLAKAVQELRQQSQLVTPSVLALREIVDQVNRALYWTEETDAKNEKELDALIGVLPTQFVVRVCEGGGHENKWATLAASLTKMNNAMRFNPTKFADIAAEAISFETAEEIVKARMVKTRDEMKAQGFSPYIALSISDTFPTWHVYTDSYLLDSHSASTLAIALSEIVSPKSPEEIKAERIAALKAELEELTGNNINA